MRSTVEDAARQEVRIPSSSKTLIGDLQAPERATALVLFAHGSGSSRHSPRNRYVARHLNEAGLGTLLLDLLTPEEEQADLDTGHLRFDVDLLALRLVEATRWVAAGGRFRQIGYFGASTGAAAALLGAAELGTQVQAVVSRGGRPDLAAERLERVLAPTLLIVGERDAVVLELNEEALARLRCDKEITVVPRATHLFEEPGALETVAELALRWFTRHLTSPPREP